MVLAAIPTFPLLAPVEDLNPIMICDVRMHPTIEMMIVREAISFGVPAHLVLGVAWSESRFNPSVISNSGAMGVMQLMPLTVRVFGVSDPFDAAQSIHAGVALFASYYRAGGEFFARCAFALGPSRCKGLTRNSYAGRLAKESSFYGHRPSRPAVTQLHRVGAVGIPLSQDPLQKIPLRSPAGRFLAHITIEEALAHKGVWQLQRNRRGNIRCVIERARASCSPLSNRGISFEQQLSSGHVWALRGVRGSGKTAAEC